MNPTQIDAIANLGHKLTLRDRTITVREVSMVNLGVFYNACAPFFEAFDEAGKLAERNKEPQDSFALFKLIAQHNQAFIQAAAISSDADSKFLGNLNPAEFFEVAALMVKVNGDFFVRALAPALMTFAKNLGQIGLTLLADSLDTVTQLETLSTIR